MPALAAVLACTVIGIADGDTLTVRCDVNDGKANITIRVAEIDAPEKGQSWGSRSRQHLAELCHSKPASLRPQTTDRYGRTVARIECDGTDASAEQVRAGMAWVFDRFVADRALYAVQDGRGPSGAAYGPTRNRWRRGSGDANRRRATSSPCNTTRQPSGAGRRSGNGPRSRSA
jgi:endonuclease YncB( thermonuclease family)